MHTVTKKTIMPFVDLTCITTEKFKTGYLTVNFITPLSAKTAAKNALLPHVLYRGTVNYPDMNSIALKLESLYGASIEPMYRKKGEALCVGFGAAFVDDDYLPRNTNLLEKIIELICELILNPNTRGGLLRSEFVESEKNKLVDRIKNSKNDKISYAVELLLRNMCKSEAYGVPKFGSESSVNSITARGLTKHYKEIIATSKLEIIYCGASEPSLVESAFITCLAALPRTNRIVKADTKIICSPKNSKISTVTDAMDVSQGKLTLGFRLGERMKPQKIASMMIFNSIYGGCGTSKLFMNVREKLSLCYYASSMLDQLKGILIVYSGVDFSNLQKAYDEILQQLENIKNNDFTDDEFESAKKCSVSSIRTRMDSPSGLESIYLDIVLSENMLPPETLLSFLAKVTREDIVNTANSVVLDTVHYLVGYDGGEANAN